MANEPEQRERVPLAEAYRRWTGREPPEPLTGAELIAWEEQLERVRLQCIEIWGEPEPDLGA